MRFLISESPNSFICFCAFSRNVAKKQKPMTRRMPQPMPRVRPRRMERQVEFSVSYQPGGSSSCWLSPCRLLSPCLCALRKRSETSGNRAKELVAPKYSRTLVGTEQNAILGHLLETVVCDAEPPILFLKPEVPFCKMGVRWGIYSVIPFSWFCKCISLTVSSPAQLWDFKSLAGGLLGTNAELDPRGSALLGGLTA